MLLRRITQHVRDQNWFAVFIDFLIVVVGVFIGIQVANWNESRLTEQEAELARIHLIADLQNDRDVYHVRRKLYSEVKQAAVRSTNILNSELPESLVNQWGFVYDAYNASAMWPFKPSGQVYNQLLNSGQLDLFSDAAVQRQMRDYYQDAALESGSTFKFESPYRDASKRLIHWKIIGYIHNHCNAIAIGDPSKAIDDNKTYFPKCSIPINGDWQNLDLQVVNSAKALYAADYLKKDANLALIQTLNLLQFLDYLDNEAATLISILEAT